MASSPLPPTVIITTPYPTTLSSSSKTASLSPLFANKAQRPTKQCSVGRVRCKAAKNGDNDHLEQGLGKLDRRNILIGLGAGGLYGAASLENNPFAFAAPISAPDFTKCGPADVPDGSTIDCCPPVSQTIIDFKFPDGGRPLRVRRAAQDVAKDPVYLAKYKKAVALMRALPEEDPRSMAQQAMVHCSYCDGAYAQIGFPDLDIQVHFNWLFFPFHRWYLYFYEKIMGELIGDPTFALPFWNWDSPAGMYLPEIFKDTTSSLYDQYRNAAHQNILLNLNYSGTDDDVTDEVRIKENLTTMYQQMVAKASSHRLFYGEPYSAGDEASTGAGAGNIESIPHNNIHFWTGDTTQKNGEDMGAFYSAGRDPLFYSHHSNVDRMWSIYKSLGGTDIEKTDWLDSELLFYDEKKNLVRVKVRDSLDTRKLGYVYDNKVPIPWLDSKPTPRNSSNKRKAAVSSADLATKFPATLSDKISVEVTRPSATKRTTAQKKAQDEVLVIKDIQFPSNETLKFDVFVNDDEDTVAGNDQSEFAGSFIHIPHKNKKTMKTNLRLSITKLLEELDAETDTTLVVTLVPKTGKGPITIGGFAIELINNT